MSELSNFSSLRYRLFTSLWLIIFTLLLLLSGCKPFDNGNSAGNRQIPNPPINTLPPQIANQLPNAQFSASPTTGEAPLDVSFDASASTDDDGSISTYVWNFGDGGNATGAMVSHIYTTVGNYTVTLTVTDDDGDTSTSTSSIVVTATAGLPPDPATIATPIATTAPASVFDTTAFLYTGANRVQTGVSEDTIVEQRAAVLRGKVITRDGQPLSGVTITVLNHAEFGQTLTRADGLFDLVVNGGGQLSVNYHKPGYIIAQRRIDIPWNDYAWLPDVALVARATESSTLDLTSSAAIQVLQGPIVNDDRGTRRATLLVPRGLSAQMRMPDGSTRSFSSNTLTVRATEFTVGKNGPEAMPGELPPGVGYTYAVELSVDEADAAGAASVQFDRPLYHYVDNFIGFPVGDEAPLYYYNRQTGNWEKEESGIVIKILAVASGMASIDTNGDDVAEDDATLAALGFTDDERSTLASLYEAGASLWRMTITHFSPYDTNWLVPMLNEIQNTIDNLEIAQEEPETNSCNSSGSIIDCQNQTLGERIPVTGTPFSLNYRSFRQPGYHVGQGIVIRPLETNASIMIQGIRITISTAGQHTDVYFDAEQIISTSDLNYRYSWDGLDAYGRPVPGEVNTFIQIGYEYSVPYMICRSSGEMYCPPIPPTEIQTRFTRRTVVLNKSAPPDQSEGGWTISAHHRYSDKAKMLHEGNGRSRVALPVGVLAAGNYAYLPGSFNTRCKDDEPANTGCHVPTSDIAILADGSLIIMDQGDGSEAMQGTRIRKIDPRGIISTLLASADPYSSQEEDLVFYPTAVAAGTDDSIYVGDCWDGGRVLRIAANGEASIFAGTGTSGFSGDGGPAASAQIGCPDDIAVGADGSLYIADNMNSRVRKVNPQGIISTVAGGGNIDDHYSDGLSATDLDGLGQNVAALAVADDGSLYLAMYNRIRKIDPTGIIWTVAGNGASTVSGDGGAAVEASLGQLQGVAIARDGSLYISAMEWWTDTGRRAYLRRITPNGIINKLQGTNMLDVPSDSGNTNSIVGRLEIGPDDGLYVAVRSDYASSGGVYRFNTTGKRNNKILIASLSGEELYRFEEGIHTATLSTHTGATLYQFSYNTAKQLTGITDANGRQTGIERDAEGKPTAIVAPGGQRTTLTVNADNYLISISNPAGEAVNFNYGNAGLLASMTDAENNTTTFSYDSDGRLVRDTDAAGDEQILARSRTPAGYHVTRTTSSGATTTYKVAQLPTGITRLFNLFANGSQSQVDFNLDASQFIITPDGTTNLTSFGPDPRFGMQTPIMSSQLLTTPGGLQTSISLSRDVQLTDRSDPLSLISLSDTTSIAGQDFLKIFDATTHEWTATSPVGRFVTESIDTSGRPTRSQTANLEATIFSYDSDGRLVSSVRGTGAAQQRTNLSYNPAGLLSRIENNSGNIASFDYDAADRLIRHTLPATREIVYAYDRNGNITSLTAPSGAVHGFSYTPVDLLAAYVAPDAGDNSATTAYRYDNDRRLTGIDRPDGSAVSITYNSGNQIQQIDDGTKTITYSYDASTGQTALIDTGEVSEARTYDGALPIGFIWHGAISGAIELGYDDSLRIISRTLNNNPPVQFGYDADGLLTSAGALAINRDLQTGRITTTSLDQVEDARSYDGFGRLLSYQASHGSTTLASFNYGYNILGRITRIVETIQEASTTYDYAYDEAGNLAQVSTGGTVIAAYRYDANGNRTQITTSGSSVAASYDAQDRLLNRGITGYTYTAAGYLASVASGGQTTRFTYTPLGDLVSVILPDGTRPDYVYDGLGRRVQERLNDTVQRGFLWGDAQLLGPLAEVNAANEVVSRFIYATHKHVPSYMVKDGVAYRIITDQIGSVRLVVNAATGTVIQRLDYDPWGVVTQDTNPGFQPFGFAGGLYNRDTGLIRIGARDYDAASGRWTAKDPLGMDGGNINLYIYADNDPVGNYDPQGTQSGTQSPANMCGGSGGMCIEPEWMCAQRCAEESLQRRTPTRGMRDRPLGCWRDSYWSMCMNGCGTMRSMPTWAEEHPILNYLEGLLTPNPYNNASFQPGNPEGNVHVGLRG